MSKSAESSNCSCIVGLQPPSMLLVGAAMASRFCVHVPNWWLPWLGRMAMPANGVDAHLEDIFCGSCSCLCLPCLPASIPAVVPRDSFLATSSFFGGKFSLQVLTSALSSRIRFASFSAFRCHACVISSSFAAWFDVAASGSQAISLLLEVTSFCSRRCHLCSCAMSPLKVTGFVYSSCVASSLREELCDEVVPGHSLCSPRRGLSSSCTITRRAFGSSCSCTEGASTSWTSTRGALGASLSVCIFPVAAAVNAPSTPLRVQSDAVSIATSLSGLLPRTCDTLLLSNSWKDSM
mmetsp:Transcript_43171/g.99503  ORF Transcript_43171/g.99503 Transcript_43171/m.99503 type:complete len:293 (-) Transcript_43171:1205-2083(-)